MNFIEEAGVNVAHSVIVSGVTNTEKDDEIIDCLKRYGSIKKITFVDDSNSLFYNNLIVEYTHRSAMTALNPILPYTYQSETDSDTVYCVKALSNESPATAGVKTPCRLQSIHSEPAGRSSLPEQAGPLLAPPRLSMYPNDLNPPEVQKVVVEHLIRTSDLNSSIRLRSFSGKSPKPNNEMDYETRRSHIELLLVDHNLPSVLVTRRILESLLSPAADVVKGLGPDTLPEVYLRVLDSAFATVQDGEELFAKFLNTFQDPGETPSAYLQRLQLTLNTVVKQGGIASVDLDKHLLKQFCRGCWDNTVINKLQLEQRRRNPPSFPEFLFLLRTEEDRQLTKDSLMKRHMTALKPRVNVHSQSACSCGHSEMRTINELKQQMQQLQSQMSALLSRKSQSSKPVPPPSRAAKPHSGSTFPPSGFSRPKPNYCFKCGEEGHISAGCNNPPNPALVVQKKKQLQQRRQVWDSKNNKSLN
ncbi:paraneoplastic antigen Ma1 homolog [Mastacembelus armatus]|uniref:paraneoplastic antigen Ma1 homolog n=1 Tax=Mastacembelus armatus TaxID=205130 RepID=UPI000E454811|nr:paraneoplastic antigen Ma1 homolog [Mastacembelus armatus]